jgi:hypothetical protein
VDALSPLRKSARCILQEFPSFHFSTIGFTSSGGSCRSTSMTMTASPEEYWRPAIVAIGWPKRRLNFSNLIRGSISRAFRITSSVLSGEGSKRENDLVRRGRCTKDRCHPPNKFGHIALFLVDRHNEIALSLADIAHQILCWRHVEKSFSPRNQHHLIIPGINGPFFQTSKTQPSRQPALKTVPLAHRGPENGLPGPR